VRSVNHHTLSILTTLLLLAGCAPNRTGDIPSIAEDDVTSVPDLPNGSSAETTTDLNLRDGPSTSHRILEVLPQGTIVLVTGRSGNWYAVDASGTSGWVSGRYLVAVATDAGTTDASTGSDSGTACEAWMGTDFTCSPDGNERGMCSSGSPIVETCDRGCLRVSTGPDVCLGPAGSGSVDCGGSWGTTKATDGDYDLTEFGCWVDASGNVHTDPGDNCVPSCLDQARNSGLCNPGDSGPDCEERVTWYTADGGRFGCLARVRITNPSNGKAVIAVALDFGPGCRVERSAGRAIVDASGRVNRYLFGADEGWSDRALIHVVEVDSSTPLGIVQ
jgi:hypothetical protein